MQKLITAAGIALGLVKSVIPVPAIAETAFESVLYGSKKTGELMPVWERFVNTQFLSL